MKNIIKALAIIALATVIGFSFAACDDGNGGTTGTAPTVTTTTLANGTVGIAYSQTLEATGDVPITWSIDTGALPAGLSLSTAGLISGTPETGGTSNFTVKAANAAGSGTKALAIVIAPISSPAKTLTGITAEYEPTTEIFTDTTLDTLREGLTVTAHYSDSTAVPVTDYTLSIEGEEFTVGENTVTVTYTEGGVTKTADFTVTADALTHEHNWSEWTTTTPATCTTAGVEVRECTAVTPSHHEDREIAIDPTAHNWNNNYTVTTPSTCMATGIETDTCSLNATHTRTQTVAINPNAHNWNNSYTVTTPATCSATGIETDNCSLNEAHTRTQSIPIDPTAHDYGNWITTAPTCTTAGIDTRTCSRNPTHKETRNETAIDPNAHAWETIPTVAVTEKTNGKEGRVCNNNHDHDEITITYATGTTGLEFNLISINGGTDNAYRVHNGGDRTFEAVHIPAFHRPDADSPYLPVTEISNGANTTASNAFGGTSASDPNTNLSTVTFAAESQLTAISNLAFAYCTSLTGITLPDSVQTISIAFSYCTSLTGITIPTSVTSLDQSAFIQCTSLTTVTFAEGIQLTTISIGTFSYCTSLTSITIPDSVISIGSVAFANCDSLASVTIPDSVESIGAQAFQYCTSLTSINIPEGVTAIGRNAFIGCTGLASVNFEGTIPSSGFDNDAFSNIGDLRAKLDLLTKQEKQRR